MKWVEVACFRQIVKCHIIEQESVLTLSAISKVELRYLVAVIRSIHLPMLRVLLDIFHSI